MLCVFSFLLDKSRQTYRHMFDCMKLAVEEYKFELKAKKIVDGFEAAWIQLAKGCFFLFFSYHENKDNYNILSFLSY